MTKEKRRMILIANAALMMAYSTNVLAMGVEAAGAPARIEMTAALGGHLANAASDPAALLASIQSTVESPASTDAELLAAVRLADAMTDPDKSLALEMGMKGNKEAANTVDAVSMAVQSDPGLTAQWMKTSKAIRLKLMQAGRFTQQQLSEAMDGSASNGSDEAVAVGAASGVAAASAHLAAPRPAPQAQVRAAVPSPVKQGGLSSLMRGGKAAAQTAPVEEAVPEVQLSAQDEQMVDAFVDEVTKLDIADFQSAEAGREEASSFGMVAQATAHQYSTMLDKPLSAWGQKGQKGDHRQIADEMIALQKTVQKLDPNKVTTQRAVSAIAKWIPKLGTSIDDYMKNAQSAKQVIEAIVTSMEAGRQALVDDNKIMRADQHNLRQSAKELKADIAIANRVVAKLEARINSGEFDEERTAFLKDIHYEMLQRSIALGTQLNANLQGVTAIDLTVNNNQQLINATNQAISEARSTLPIAAMIAVALSRQASVLEAVTAARNLSYTSMEKNSIALKKQGAQIHETAFLSAANLQKLKNANANLNEAITAVNKFKTEAVPKMKATIKDLNKLNAEAEKTAARAEKMSQFRPRFFASLDAEKSKK